MNTPLPPVELRCEYLRDPLGIDVIQPRLSWQMLLPNATARGARQKGYQILVASNQSLLNEDRGDRWDSGKVASDESIHIAYNGASLQSQQVCFWKVRVWNEDDESSAWSESAQWSMGLLKPGDWQGQWIGLDEVDFREPTDDHRRLPARMLRREFQMRNPVTRATVHMSGLGFSELSINGRRIGDRLMDPTHSHYEKRLMYVTHDVTDFLKTGGNTIGVLLGNGRFFAPRLHTPVTTPSFGFPKLLFQMHLEYSDGSTDTIVSDETWKITDSGPIRANNEFDGEEYDARMEMAGWDAASFDDSHWQSAERVAAPGGRCIAQMHEPMRITQRLRPVAITQPMPGKFVADFGQNLYGMVKIQVQGPEGTRITVRTTFDKGEDGMIDMAPNRSALSTDIYTLKGDGLESWAPRFRGQGMRYAEITGWPGVPTLEDLEMQVVHSDLEEVGAFSCSNELVNSIYANLRRTVRMQERGVPMDPDRDERQAWLSVSEKTSETEGYLYNVAAFYKSFLGEARIDQRDDGCISDAGSFWAWAYTGDPCWPAVVTTTPWSCYWMYGDRRLLEENYPMMKRWVKYLESRLDPDFIYRQGTYGDWVDAYSMDKTTRSVDGAALDSLADDPELQEMLKAVPDHGATSRYLLATAYAYHNFSVAARTAEFLNQSADGASFRNSAEKIAKAFHEEFFDRETHTYKSKTQTSYVLPLAFGMVPTEYRDAVIENLLHDILVNHQGHLSVGCVGIKWLMQTLTEVGRTDVAYKILTQETRPSWGYMVRQGGTSIWERWDCDTRDPGMNGQSQTILAGYLGAWIYQTLGGIQYDSERPAFKHIILRPQPVGDLQWVKCTFRSPHGLIRSEWEISGDEFHWQVTVPANTSATIYVPAGDPGSVLEGGQPAASAPGVTFQKSTSGCAIFEIQSGNFEFRSHYAAQQE